jgi:pentatricopeptide repeat protein
VVNNHLATGLVKYFVSYGRYDQAMSFFGNLRESDPKVDALVAQIQMSMGS